MVGNPKFIIYSTGDGVAIRAKWLGKLRQAVIPHLHPLVLRSLAIKLAGPDSLEIQGWTECIHGGQSLRAHPNFRSQGEWYDWAMVRYGTYVPRTDDRYWGKADSPSKILAFVQVPAKYLDDNSLYEDNLDSNVSAALVISCEDLTPKNLDSVLCQQYNMETERVKVYIHPKDSAHPPSRTASLAGNTTVERPFLRLIAMQNILERVFVVQETVGTKEFYIPSIGDTTDVLLVKNRDRVWAKAFSTGCCQSAND